jgi:hypothetical protein
MTFMTFMIDFYNHFEKKRIGEKKGENEKICGE